MPGQRAYTAGKKWRPTWTQKLKSFVSHTADTEARTGWIRKDCRSRTSKKTPSIGKRPSPKAEGPPPTIDSPTCRLATRKITTNSSNLWPCKISRRVLRTKGTDIRDRRWGATKTWLSISKSTKRWNKISKNSPIASKDQISPSRPFKTWNIRQD